VAAYRLYNWGKFWFGGAVRVDFAHHRRSTGHHSEVQRRLNIHPLAARLIIGQMATLIQLQTVYSLPDMRYMDEVLNLREEAEYLNAKRNNDG
jgi:hypothetical protein